MINAINENLRKMAVTFGQDSEQYHEVGLKLMRSGLKVSWHDLMIGGKPVDLGDGKNALIPYLSSGKEAIKNYNIESLTALYEANKGENTAFSKTQEAKQELDEMNVKFSLRNLKRLAYVNTNLKNVISAVYLSVKNATPADVEWKDTDEYKEWYQAGAQSAGEAKTENVEALKEKYINKRIEETGKSRLEVMEEIIKEWKKGGARDKKEAKKRGESTKKSGKLSPSQARKLLK